MDALSAVARDLVRFDALPLTLGVIIHAVFGYEEDVVHPTFGEGVVTGLEPGGIVVIRFASDRSERKLVADLAPITRR